MSNVFLDNLKTATHWVLKAVGVEYLLGQVNEETAPTCSHRYPLLQHREGSVRISWSRRLAGASPAGHCPAPDAGPPERGGRGAFQGAGDRADGDLPVHPPVPGPVCPVADAQGTGRDRGSDADPPLLRQHRGGGRRPGHCGRHAGALCRIRPAVPRVPGGTGTPLAAAGRPAVEGPGLLSSERAAGGAADPGRADLRLTDPLLRGEGCPSSPS